MELSQLEVFLAVARERRFSRAAENLYRTQSAVSQTIRKLEDDLGESLVDASGVVHAMAGLLGVETSFEKRRMTLGYREARIASDCALGTTGLILRGHEFHYAIIIASGGDDPFAYVRDVYGAPEAPSGSRRGKVTGSFFHVIAEA